MKKEQKRINSTVSFSSHPSFIIQSVDGTESKVHLDDVKEDELVLAPLVDLPPPPDGGWGWVVVFASFMCNLILDGIAYTFGVLLEKLVVHFDSNRATVSWVGSLLCGVYLMSGPIVGGLVNKFGCRPVCILGSIIACAGLSLSTLSPNVPILMLTYGVIGGLGLGMIYLPAVICVGYYFESKRALATGISVCGSGVGTFLFAPLATYLSETYGWKGSNLIFAGLCLNCAVFGALMRPLELKAKLVEPTDLLEEEDEELYEDESVYNFMVIDSDKKSLDIKNKEMDPLMSDNDTGAQQHQQINLEKHPIARIPTLAMIEEQSITAALTKVEEQRTKVTDIFPSQETPSEDPPSESSVANCIGEQSSKHAQRKPSRLRTVSESQQNRFQLTPIRKKLGPIPRNSSAPHFIDANKILQRNVSTPGFGNGSAKLSSQLSQEDSSSHVLFGIEVGSTTQLSNTQLYLEPSSLSRRGSHKRNSGPLVRPFSRKDLFYGGSVLNLVEKQQDMPSKWDHYRHSIISTPRRLSSAPRGSIVASHLSLGSLNHPDRKPSAIPDEFLEPEGTQPILSALKEMINIELALNPMFLLIGFSNIFGMLGFYVPFVYLPGLTLSKLPDLPVEDANFLLSVIGISNTIGRVLAGWFSDFSWVDSLLVTNVAIFLSGVSVFVLPLCNSYGLFVFVALMFGFFVAAYISLTSIVLVDLLGLDNLTSAFGLLVLYRGVCSMIGTPVAGAVYDATQSYDISFYMAGGFLILASLISFGAQLLKRKKQKSAKLDHDIKK